MRLASTRFGGWFATTVIPPIDRFFLRLSDGKWSMAGIGVPTLLLTTTGRKSGLPRQTPLLYLPQEDEQIAIVGSRGGRQDHAQWYLNICVDPNVEVTLHGATRAYTANILEGDAYDRLWQRFIAYNPGFQRYQNRVERQIPLILLVPTRPHE